VTVAGAETVATGLAGHRIPARAAIAAACLLGLVIAVASLGTSELWADEAQSVAIADLPFGSVLDGVRRDGHPPLYYLVLHGWLRVTGDSTVAVRSLSLLFMVAAVPVLWRAGHRYGGVACAWIATLLVSTSPQTNTFGTSARMYALVVLLAACGWLALRSALEAPTLRRLGLVAACSGLLLLTHYWALYLVAATASVLAWRWRREHSAATGRVLGAVAAGALLFVPWLPAFLDQVRTTGTPWGAPGRPGQVAEGLLAGETGTGEASVLGMGLVLLAILAIVGAARPGGSVEIGLPTRDRARGEGAVLLLTLVLAVAGGFAFDIAFAARYTAVVFPLLVLLAALGATLLPRGSPRGAVLAVLAVLGLMAALVSATQERTQAGAVADAVRAGPAGVVAYCPDQLGPAVSRLLPGADQVTFPDLRRPERIDWVDYRDRVGAGDPAAFADAVLDRAGGRPVWLVWAPGYAGLGRRCEGVVEELARRRPAPDIVVTAGEEGEAAWLYRFSTP
jgi:mannosyltransferase